jgi:hypothetical protein
MKVCHQGSLLESTCFTLTERQNTNGFAEIAGLAIGAAGIFEHAGDKPEFAEKAVFSRTICRNMGFRETADRSAVMQHLYQCIGVGIKYMRFEAAVVGFVEESTAWI